MIRRSTWIVLVLLLALVGFSFYLRDRQARQPGTATPTGSILPLFEGAKIEPTFVRVESSLGVVVQFSRNEAGKWVLDAPAHAEADQAAAEAAATQAASLRVLSTVNLPPDVIGLDKPKYTLTVRYGDGIERTLRIGSETPIKDGYYAQLDDGPFQVVDKTGLDPLIQLLTSPPYLETPTPLASPTSPASPTPSEVPVTQTPDAATLPSSPAPDSSPTATP